MKQKRSSRKIWLLIKIFAIHSPFFFPLFLGEKRKGEKNNQSRGQKSCLSARSIENSPQEWLLTIKCHLLDYHFSFFPYPFYKINAIFEKGLYILEHFVTFPQWVHGIVITFFFHCMYLWICCTFVIFYSMQAHKMNYKNMIDPNQ